MHSLFRRHYLLITILLLAAFLRLYRIYDYTEFLGDQGRDLVIVKDFLTHGNLFFIGPQTSIGNMYLGPFYYYFIAPSLLLSHFHPLGPSVFIALIGVATVYLVYLFSLRWFNQPAVSYIAAFFFAISPTVIKYSTFSWNPNIMPFFALTFVYFLHSALSQPSRYHHLIFASLSFVMALNSHYLALLLLPFAAIYCFFHLYHLLSIRSAQWRPFLTFSFISALVLLVSFLPQLAFDLKHQGQNMKALFAFFSQRQTTVNLKAYKALPLLGPLFAQVNTRLLFGKYDSVSILANIVFFLGIIFTSFRSLKNNSALKNPIFLVISWYLSGLIGLGLYKQHIYDHYFGFIFPPVFILAGLVISQTWQTSKLFFRLFAIVFFGFITVVSVLQNPFRFSPPRQLQRTNAITDSILKSSQGQPFNLALLAKQNYDPPYRYYFDLKHAPLYNLPDHLTQQLFVICEPHPDINCQPINHPEWGIAAFGWAKIDQEWQIDGVKIFRLVHLPSSTSLSSN
jgi:4-amino-4-deoxy-L-arabinose transferase-like glycosyltransferase